MSLELLQSLVPHRASRLNVKEFARSDVDRSWSRKGGEIARKGVAFHLLQGTYAQRISWWLRCCLSRGCSCEEDLLHKGCPCADAHKHEVRAQRSRTLLNMCVVLKRSVVCGGAGAKAGARGQVSTPAGGGTMRLACAFSRVATGVPRFRSRVCCMAHRHRCSKVQTSCLLYGATTTQRSKVQVSRRRWLWASRPVCRPVHCVLAARVRWPPTLSPVCSVAAGPRVSHGSTAAVLPRACAGADCEA